MKYFYMYLIATICLAFAMSLPSTQALAQGNSSISGKVLDESGVGLPGANVTLVGTSIGAATDENGEYKMNNVEPGIYVIVASSIGYKEIRKEITVTDMPMTLDFTLKDETTDLDEVVVTGSSNPRTKLESSVAVMSLGSKAIENLAPLSTAALLQTVPGFLVEASGGEIGNNLFARGIPSAGAYEYVQIQEDGLPVFEDGALQFANADIFYRLDETVNKMEAVRGGSASIFAANAPGGIINFISKTGQNELQGRVKFSVGDYGLFRSDLNLSGALIKDKLFFNVGGFYRADDGIRHPGFTANKGGQVKMNLTYKFDDGGHLRLYYKRLDDRNTFYLPIPLTTDDNGKIKGYEGFNPNYGTLTSVNFSRLNVPQYHGGTFSSDLQDGVHPVVNTVGAEFEKDLSDKIVVKNALKFTQINLNYNAIYNGGGPYTQRGYAADSLKASYTYVDDGAALDPNALIMNVDPWHINKKMENFANNLSFSFDLAPVNLTVGYYYSNWTSNQYWNWSRYLVNVSDNPRLVNVRDEAGTSYTWNGIERITRIERDAQTQGKLNDFYINAEVKATEKLNFEAGLRYDYNQYFGYLNDGSYKNLGLLPNNTADDQVASIKDTPYKYWRYQVKEVSYTAAANYKFTEQMAAYLRYSHGLRAPIEEAFYANVNNLGNLKNTFVDQLELGYKYANKYVTLNANLFYMNLKNVAFTDILASGRSENRFADVRNVGLEVESDFRYRAFRLGFNFTLQQPKYRNFAGTGTDGIPFDFSGNTARRIPNFFFTLRPEANITDKLAVYVQCSYFRKKYQEEANQITLPGYATIEAGVSYTIKKFRFSVDGSNLFNAIGLTEGDPRRTTSSTNVFLARPILGRAFRASVAVSF